MFKQLRESSGNVLGFKIFEDTVDEDVREISRIMSEAVAASGRIRLLVEIEGFRHMELDDLLGKLGFAADHASQIERMAVLSSRVWIKSWVKLGGPVTGPDVEHFDRHKIDAAWEWIRS